MRLQRRELTAGTSMVNSAVHPGSPRSNAPVTFMTSKLGTCNREPADGGDRKLDRPGQRPATRGGGGRASLRLSYCYAWGLPCDRRAQAAPYSRRRYSVSPAFRSRSSARWLRSSAARSRSSAARSRASTASWARSRAAARRASPVWAARSACSASRAPGVRRCVHAAWRRSGSRRATERWRMSCASSSSPCRDPGPVFGCGWAVCRCGLS
jgi:hypothetical protein